MGHSHHGIPIPISAMVTGVQNEDRHENYVWISANELGEFPVELVQILHF